MKYQPTTGLVSSASALAWQMQTRLLVLHCWMAMKQDRIGLCSECMAQLLSRDLMCRGHALASIW
jgi:hypothetical protein